MSGRGLRPRGRRRAASPPPPPGTPIPLQLINDPVFRTFRGVQPYLESATIPHPVPASVLAAVRSFLCNRRDMNPRSSEALMDLATAFELDLLSARRQDGMEERLGARIDAAVVELKRHTSDEVGALRREIQWQRREDECRRSNAARTLLKQNWVPVTSHKNGRSKPHDDAPPVERRAQIDDLNEENLKEWLDLYDIPSDGDFGVRKQLLGGFLGGV
ncbi:hypothetical protein I316_06508 [Kwoniella heveanensis BCC8398]|uniref:Uncharacterized protein n=1 Tax=Kwoniella heveanensis BCC8398 TaxID=1296120 RepID=A0A1B9GLL4_9TREE|nr:hypothetical protein I316_06508 [Kwoniella heveanensis BCC8398]